MKFKIACVAIALLALSACSTKENDSGLTSSSQDSSNVSITVKENTPEVNAVKEIALQCLGDYYEEDKILSVSQREAKIEVKVLGDSSTTANETPDGWDDVRDIAEQSCSAVQSGLEGHDVKTVIVYLVDAEDNNLVSVLNGKISYDVFEGADPGTAVDNPGTISLAEFNAIKTGMEYQEVFDIIGSRGTVLSEVDIGMGDEYYTIVFQWDGEGSLGANANVTFQGGKVTTKAQFGLA